MTLSNLDLAILDGASASKTLIHADDGTGKYIQTTALRDGDGSLVTRTNPTPVYVPPVISAVQTFTRPANTTAYTAGDMVANSATAGSVTPMQFTIARANDIPARIISGSIMKSGTTNPPTGAIFYLHLYSAAPTVSASSGDNLAFQTTDKDIYLGVMQGTTDRLFDDGFWGALTPVTRLTIPFAPATGTQIIYGLLEVRGALAPASGEVFTVKIEAE